MHTIRHRGPLGHYSIGCRRVSYGDAGLLGGVPLDRQRVPLFGRARWTPRSPKTHGVRLFDDVLSAVDWSLWEAECGCGSGAQPLIHPRHLAAAILYGLYRSIRSSRKLEEACYYRLDFIWLLEGRRPDHSTLAKFRTRFRQPLKDLFRQLGALP